MSIDHVHVLFKQFTALRLAGYGRNDAWFEIEETARGLSQIDQKRLISLLQQWEKQIVTDAKASDPFDTKEQPPDGWEQARQYAADERRRSVIRRIDLTPPGSAGNGTPAGEQPSVPCPQCHRQNEANAAYCYSCGTPMGAAITSNATRPLPGVETDNAYFDDTLVLYLKVVGGDARLQVDPSMHETILGRKTADSVMIPDVDLSPFGAGEQGVSRLHASLRRQNNTVVITDLGSRNYTHINGQRLHAHEVRVLHDGDEIRLGRLVMYVYFAPK